NIYVPRLTLPLDAPAPATILRSCSADMNVARYLHSVVWSRAVSPPVQVKPFSDDTERDAWTSKRRWPAPLDALVRNRLRGTRVVGVRTCPVLECGHFRNSFDFISLIHFDSETPDTNRSLSKVDFCKTQIPLW